MRDMRDIVPAGIGMLVLLGLPLGGAAWSQETAAEADATLDPPSRSARAPIVALEVDALEPAVDVGNLGAPSAPVAQTAPRAARAGAAPGAGQIIDTLDLGTTSITGNQELPKVLYIVPWKRSDLGDLVGRPVNTLLDEVLAPVDPEVFERHLEYYDTLYGVSQEE